MELDVHNVDPKGFLRLLSVIRSPTECEKSGEGKFYMTGHIDIGDNLTINLHTKDYSRKFGVVESAIVNSHIN